MPKTKPKKESKFAGEMLRNELDGAVERSRTVAELLMYVAAGMTNVIGDGHLPLTRGQRSYAAERMLSTLTSIAIHDMAEPKLTAAQRASGQDFVDVLASSLARIEEAARSPSSSKAHRAALAAQVMRMAHALLGLPQ